MNTDEPTNLYKNFYLHFYHTKKEFVGDVLDSQYQAFLKKYDSLLKSFGPTNYQGVVEMLDELSAMHFVVGFLAGRVFDFKDDPGLLSVFNAIRKALVEQKIFPGAKLPRC